MSLPSAVSALAGRVADEFNTVRADVDAKIAARHITFNPGYDGTNRRWCRLVTLNGVNATNGAHAEFILAGVGDFGGDTRATMLINTQQRGDDTITVRAWAWDYANARNPVQLHTKQISTYVFELWGRFAVWNQPHVLHVLHDAGQVTWQGDSVTSTAPTGISDAYVVNDYDTDVSGDVIRPETYGAVGDGDTDDTTALQDALDAAAADRGEAGGVVQLAATDYLTGPLTIPHSVTLRGMGRGSSRLVLKAGSAAACLTFGAHTSVATVADLRIDGNKSEQTSAAAHGVHVHTPDPYDNTLDDYTDPRNTVRNVHIEYCKGDGLLFEGRGANQFTNVWVWLCDGNGVTATGRDSYFTNVDVGGAGLDGFYVEGADLSFLNCKAWFSGQISAAGGVGNGWHISSYGGFRGSGLAAQDSARAGFYLDGAGRAVLTAVFADSNGTAGNGDPGVDLNLTSHTVITGYSWDRNANPNRQGYALRIGNDSDDNTIQLRSDQNGIGVLDPTSVLTDNDVYVNGWLTPIGLPADPAGALHAATKQYVDTATTGHTHTGYATTGHTHDLSGYVPTTQRGLIGGAASSSGTGAWAPDAAAASEHRRTATGATTVNLPTGGVDTQLLRLWFNASGADRVITFASGYEVSQPVPGRVFTIPSGTWGEVLAANRAGTWVLIAAYPQTITSAAAQNVAYAATVTPDAGTGSRFKTTATGNMTINPPSNGTDGQAILYAVTASGANRAITLSSSIALTTALVSPYTVNSGKTGFFGLRYNGTSWTLIAQTQEL